MGKKKEDTIQDIIDRLEEDLITLRDKVQELEDNQCECDSSDDDDEFEDDDLEDEDE